MQQYRRRTRRRSQRRPIVKPARQRQFINDEHGYSAFARAVSPTELCSTDGMQPAIWGPLLWTIMHTVSFNYPDNVKPNDSRRAGTRAFFDALPLMLPCADCRPHLAQNYKTLHYGDHVFSSRQTLSRFVYDLHQLVNAQLNKPPFNVSYEELCRRYELFRSKRSCAMKCNACPGRSVIQIVPRMPTQQRSRRRRSAQSQSAGHRGGSSLCVSSDMFTTTV